MKQKVAIVLSLVFFFSCTSKSTHKPGVVKTDTITALYITSAYGPLQGGPVIRTVAYQEKVTTKDSVTFTRSVELDTVCTVFTARPDIDSVTKKQKVDSAGTLKYKSVPVNLPSKYVMETGIPTH